MKGDGNRARFGFVLVKHNKNLYSKRMKRSMKLVMVKLFDIFRSIE